MPRQFGKTDGSTRWSCEKCRRQHEPGSSCPPTGTWLYTGTPAAVSGVIWLKRPMPDGQWPPGQRSERDDSFSWWVRSHCGHAARQWAFYSEADADVYESVFRADPCHFTRCRDQRRGTRR